MGLKHSLLSSSDGACAINTLDYFQSLVGRNMQTYIHYVAVDRGLQSTVRGMQQVQLRAFQEHQSYLYAFRVFLMELSPSEIEQALPASPFSWQVPASAEATLGPIVFLLGAGIAPVSKPPGASSKDKCSGCDTMVRIWRPLVLMTGSMP